MTDEKFPIPNNTEVKHWASGGAFEAVVEKLLTSIRWHPHVEPFNWTIACPSIHKILRNGWALTDFITDKPYTPCWMTENTSLFVCRYWGVLEISMSGIYTALLRAPSNIVNKGTDSSHLEERSHLEQVLYPWDWMTKCQRPRPNLKRTGALWSVSAFWVRVKGCNPLEAG